MKVKEKVVRPGGFELPTFWFVAVRSTLPNLARGVANRTKSASWGNSRKPLSPSFVVVCRTFAADFCNLRYIFVTATKLSENACLMVICAR